MYSAEFEINLVTLLFLYGESNFIFLDGETAKIRSFGSLAYT